jgi:Putative sensor
MRRMSIAKRWGRDFLFHVAGLATSIAGFALWVSGVTTTASLAVTVVGILVALVFFWLLRWFARLERHRAAIVLVAEVADDGRGGADPQGAGLLGLARRVAALDGALTIVSPSGGGTTLHAELPAGA